VSLRLSAQLILAVDRYAKFLGGSTDRTYVIAQAIEIALAQDADFQKTLTSRAAGVAAGPARDRVTTALHNTLTPGGARLVPHAERPLARPRCR